MKQLVRVVNFVWLQLWIKNLEILLMPGWELAVFWWGLHVAWFHSSWTAVWIRIIIVLSVVSTSSESINRSVSFALDRIQQINLNIKINKLSILIFRFFFWIHPRHRILIKLFLKSSFILFLNAILHQCFSLTVGTFHFQLLDGPYQSHLFSLKEGNFGLQLPNGVSEGLIFLHDDNFDWFPIEGIIVDFMFFLHFC